MARTKLTPPQLAREWGVGSDKIRGLIRAGELRAIDVATRRGGRPRFLIDRADIAAFEGQRAVVPAVKVARRRRKSQLDVIQFF